MERKLHEVKPREQSGRDSYSRYKAQVRSAALAALSILEGKAVDRVYCDLHDDFVVRKVVDGKTIYTFYQVKTKGKKNYQWTLNDLFGLNKRIRDQTKQNNEAIRQSFVGKLLAHTVLFGESCEAVVFQTNIHINDDVEEVLVAITSGDFDNPYAQLLIERFKPCFDEGDKRNYSCIDLLANLQKLQLQVDVQYIKETGDFEPIARQTIYRYSEVDLEQAEVGELLMKLLALVDKKSAGIIQEITESSIEDLAGISVEDLLPILSISEDAYNSLVSGGDQKAVKSASIIQRSLSKAGANEAQIEYCSRCKTKWDIWYRNNRHVLSEFDLNIIVEGIRKLVISDGCTSSIELSKLRGPIYSLINTLRSQGVLYDLNEDLVLGGIFAEIVRMKS